MKFSVQHYLNRGTSTPCVARTAIQTHQLVSGYPLSESQRKDLTETSADVMNHLIACLDSAEPIVEAIGQLREGYRKSGDRLVGVESIEIPGVPGLRKAIESFLYDAKLTLRDTGNLVRPLHDQTFGHRYDRLRRWAQDTLGTGCPIDTLLADEEQWISEVIAMRNAVEHPKPPDKVLSITDFRLTTPGVEGVRLEDPTIQLGTGEVSPIAEFLTETQDRLLSFYEALLCTLLRPTGEAMGIDIREIPEGDRDPKNPVRFRAVIDLKRRN